MYRGKKRSRTGKSANNINELISNLRFKRLLQFSIPLFFFSCLFFYLLLYINPSVIHSCNGFNIHTYVSMMHAPKSSSSIDMLYRPLFIFELTSNFFREIATSPGGWTRLAVIVCIYACHYPISGAFAITGLSFFFYVFFGLYIKKISYRWPLVFNIIPAFFIIVMCAWYELSFCQFLLPVAGALALVAVYQRLRPATDLTTILWITVLFWLSWYLLQWGSFLLLLFIVIHQLFSRGHKTFPVAVSVAVNAVLLLTIDTWFIPLKMTIRWSEFTRLSGLPFFLVIFFPITAIILASMSRFLKASLDKGKKVVFIVQVSLLVISTVTLVIWVHREPINRDTRIIARTVHNIMNGQWETILNEKYQSFFTGFPQKSGPLHTFIVHVIDHSLYRAGRLGDRLFSFPQASFSYDPLLLFKSLSIQSYVNWYAILDLTMDLGMVNTAEKITAELMENMGPYPDIIYRRALIQIAKGNNKTAAVYLSKLIAMPFYREKARHLLHFLNKEEPIAQEPEIAAMHANMDTVDYLIDNERSSDNIFKDLLKSNPGNKAAYDYLMSYHLLNGQLEEIANLAQSAASYGYTELPRHWEEALYIYTSVRSNATPVIPSSWFHKETIDGFNNFTRIWTQMRNSPGIAAHLAPTFGNSYFYYFAFKYSAGKFQ
jgi:hypothetical protein